MSSREFDLEGLAAPQNSRAWRSWVRTAFIEIILTPKEDLAVSRGVREQTSKFPNSGVVDARRAHKRVKHQLALLD